jgi:methylated-DNA-[protein]-cysteine S-methyltransferase
MYKYSIFETPLGYMGAVSSAEGLHMVILPKRKAEEVKRALEEHYTEDLLRDEKGMEKIKQKIKGYLEGKVRSFKEKMDVSGITPFEMKVWDTVIGIPYGEVRSYAWVAGKVGAPRKGRAVGQALKRNRLPVVIPCHRVINKTGDLGGFSDGVEMKRKLLNIEGRLW